MTSSRWNTARSRRWLRTCASVGDDPRLIGEPSIFADGKLLIGDRFRFASQPVPSHLVAGPDATLRIGNDVSIGCGAAIAAFQNVDIGDGTLIGPFVIIMDTNFHGAPGNQSVQHDCRPVTIGKDCRIGSRVTIGRGATIGDGAEILAGSVVSSAVPPGVCVAGARARIIGRAGDIASRWDSAAAALPDLLMTALELPAPPDIDSNPIPAQLWTDSRIQHLLNAIEARFGVALDVASALKIGSFADIAATIEHALLVRSRA